MLRDSAVPARRVRKRAMRDSVSDAVADELLVEQTQAAGADRVRLMRQKASVVVGDELTGTEGLAELVLLLERDREVSEELGRVCEAVSTLLRPAARRLRPSGLCVEVD